MANSRPLPRLVSWDSISSLNLHRRTVAGQPVRPESNLICVSFMIRQEIDDNEISDVPTQPATRGQIKAEMLAGENPAQRRFLGNGREARERTLHAGQDFRCHGEFEMIGLEERAEYFRRGRADNGM